MPPDINGFIKTLRGGKARYIPIAELGVHPIIKEKFIGRPLQSLQDDVDFWRQAGYDYIKLQPIADFNPDKIGVDPAQMEIREGSLSYNWASEGKGVIEDRASFERYRFPETVDFDYSRFEQVKDLLPEGMGVIGQYGDIFTMTWEMMGFESFSMALFEDPNLLTALNDKIGALVLSMFEYFARSDAVDVLWYSDDIAFSTGLLMSPEVLRQYFFPWLRKIGDLAKAAGKPLIYHTDGKLWDVMDEIIACGVDALHPIEPKAMDIKEVKARYGDKLCLIGHVDVDLLARGRPEQIRQKVKENIEIAGYNGGYVVGSGNSIPDYVPLENYKAMLEAAREFG
ncbi:MAG TPA: nucleoside 2-deoxyribosyltransferase [Calditrichaeota bacterium]|nr:nucleoside 2-deoxyribosyltransferase [Calditrichota bacterium]